MRLPSGPFVPACAAALFLAACAAGPIRKSRYGDRETIDIGSVPGDTAFARGGFGTSPLPVWSRLTPPEIRALQGRDRAAGGDNRALLELAVFASGDVRTDSGYAAIAARFDAFVAGQRPVLEGIASPDRKAERLLRSMHKHFFKRGNAAPGRQPGYDYDQSAFTGVFLDGRFNCVSSALLYVLLAREFGFVAQGAVMPRHAYAHLVFPDGRSAEVETTTPDGYENAHTGSAAPARPSSWYRERGLDPDRALDYARRRLVDPIEFIGFNMRNQHLLGLPLEDRYRILEAGAWVFPGARQAQIDRVAVWELEFRYLTAREDRKTAQRLSATIAPLLPEARARLEGDSAGFDHPAWLAYCVARAESEMGNLERAFAWSDSALAWLKPGGDPQGAIRGNVMGLLMRASQKHVEAGRFAQAERLLLRYPVFARDSADYRANLSWVYSNWSHAAWKASDWAAAIDRLEKALKYARAGDTAPLEQNLASAYFNKALAYRERGENGKAEEALRLCRSKAPRAKGVCADM